MVAVIEYTETCIEQPQCLPSFLRSRPYTDSSPLEEQAASEAKQKKPKKMEDVDAEENGEEVEGMGMAINQEGDQGKGMDVAEEHDVDNDAIEEVVGDRRRKR
jgi:hypothetical protein